MKVISSPISGSQWDRFFAVPTIEPIDPGFQTISQIAKERGFTTSGIKKRITPGVRSGEIEVRKFRVIMNGKLRCIPHYRSKDYASNKRPRNNR